jgi:hypothetical protein
MIRHFSGKTYNTDEVDIHLDLSGSQGNAFVILGVVENTLKTLGFSKEEVKEYYDEATSSDYKHLLETTLQYINLCDDSEKVVKYDVEEKKHIVMI